MLLLPTLLYVIVILFSRALCFIFDVIVILFFRAPRFMGEGFTVIQSRTIDVHYYMDEPGIVIKLEQVYKHVVYSVTLDC